MRSHRCSSCCLELQIEAQFGLRVVDDDTCVDTSETTFVFVRVRAQAGCRARQSLHRRERSSASFGCMASGVRKPRTHPRRGGTRARRTAKYSPRESAARRLREAGPRRVVAPAPFGAGRVRPFVGVRSLPPAISRSAWVGSVRAEAPWAKPGIRSILPASSLRCGRSAVRLRRPDGREGRRAPAPGRPARRRNRRTAGAGSGARKHDRHASRRRRRRCGAPRRQP